MKKLFICLFMIMSIDSFSQSLSLENPKLLIEDRTYTLTDVDDWGNHIIKYEKIINDAVVESGTFYNGLKHGTWTAYREDGSVLSMIKFDKGERVWMKSYVDDKNIHVIYKNNKVSEVTYYLAQN